MHIVGHHHRRGAQRVVQTLDQRGDGAQGDGVQAGEGLVVQHQVGVECNGARQRHPPRHAARQLGRHQPGRAAQADGLQFHQDQIANHRVWQAGVFAQRKGDVVLHG